MSGDMPGGGLKVVQNRVCAPFFKFVALPGGIVAHTPSHGPFLENRALFCWWFSGRVSGSLHKSAGLPCGGLQIQQNRI